MNKALRLDYQETAPPKIYSSAATGSGNQAIRPGGDALLRPFLEAATSIDADQCLERILRAVQPVIGSIIKSKLQVSLKGGDGSRENQEALEIRSEIQASLIASLRELQERRRQAINNFQSYVAVVTFNACYEYLRRKYPRRHSLKNKLRYLLSHRITFSVWEIDGVLCGGLIEWRFQKRAPVKEGDLRRLLDASHDPLRFPCANAKSGAEPLAELVFGLFRQAGGPIELDNLASLIADLLYIKEERQQAEDDESDRASLYEALPERGANPSLDVERRLRLERLWIEICQLPQAQRAALLLNMRDSCGSGGGVDLFPVTGVASFGEMARALKMSREELAVLWNELPLDDSAIAGRLAITRQQVINLRKSARERLARRMKDLW